MEKGMTEITDIVFSQQNKEREEREESVEESVDVNSKESGQETVLNSLIAGILHPSGGGGDKRDGSAAVDEREGHKRESGAASDGGGGLLDNIVSHLPAPLSDDAAPASEEASILIHAIVRD